MVRSLEMRGWMQLISAKPFAKVVAAVKSIFGFFIKVFIYRIPEVQPGMKLWGGRFSKNTDSAVDDFNSSIGFDCRLYRQDIEGSIAHVRMLGKCGIIPVDEAS